MRAVILLGTNLLLMYQTPALIGHLIRDHDVQNVIKCEGQSLLNTQSQLLKDFKHFRNTLTDQLADFINEQLPLDCSGAQARGDWRIVTQIKPPGLSPRKVRCEQFVEGGGWTVIVYRNSEALFPKEKRKKRKNIFHQRSIINSFDKGSNENYKSGKWDENSGSHLVKKFEATNFNRTWGEYREGFGNPESEYWIGNEVLQALTRERGWRAAVLLEDWSGRKGYAFWSSFRVHEEEKNYRLEISGYDENRSNLGDGLAYHNGKSFSTVDADNEDYYDHCAKTYGGGWWFNQCHVSHLTGIHLGPGKEGYHSVHWRPWKGNTEALKMAVLMIRPPKPTSL